MAEQQVSVPFTFRIPFQTRCGWPARLLGVAQRTAFPYIVAVWNPAFNAEEIHAYDADGKQPVKANVEKYGVIGGPLSLVNISDEDYYAIEQKTEVHAHVVELDRLPPNCNPFHHDHGSMGSELVRGWMALHEGYGRPDFPSPMRHLDMVNTVTGQRFRIVFTPVHQKELEHNKQREEAKDG